MFQFDAKPEHLEEKEKFLCEDADKNLLTEYNDFETFHTKYPQALSPTVKQTQFLSNHNHKENKIYSSIESLSRLTVQGQLDSGFFVTKSGKA